MAFRSVGAAIDSAAFDPTWSSDAESPSATPPKAHHTASMAVAHLPAAWERSRGQAFFGHSNKKSIRVELHVIKIALRS
jgi:hypothetical protein